MQITNVSGFDRMIAATGATVAAGETIEVDDDLGGSLCEQPANWAKVEPVAPVTPSKKKSESSN